MALYDCNWWILTVQNTTDWQAQSLRKIHLAIVNFVTQIKNQIVLCINTEIWGNYVLNCSFTTVFGVNYTQLTFMWTVVFCTLTASTERRDGSEISLPYLSVVRSREDGDRGSSRQSITPGQRQRAGGDGWVCLQPGSLARYYHRDVSPTQLWAILSKLWWRDWLLIFWGVLCVFETFRDQ